MDVSNDVLRDLTEDEDRGLGDDAARRRDGGDIAVGDVSQRKLANPVPAVTELRADPAPQDARLARARAGEHTFIHAYTHRDHIASTPSIRRKPHAVEARSPDACAQGSASWGRHAIERGAS